MCGDAGFAAGSFVLDYFDGVTMSKVKLGYQHRSNRRCAHAATREVELQRESDTILLGLQWQLNLKSKQAHLNEKEASSHYHNQPFLGTGFCTSSSSLPVSFVASSAYSPSPFCCTRFRYLRAVKGSTDQSVKFLLSHTLKGKGAPQEQKESKKSCRVQHKHNPVFTLRVSQCENRSVLVLHLHHCLHLTLSRKGSPQEQKKE